jgi:hypothetical protein
MQQLRSLRQIAVATLAARILISPLSAENFDTRHAHDLAGNPADLHFRLDTTGGQRPFHLGERIPLTLEFSSDSLDKYKLNGATYDRSGRLPTEEFVVEQGDVVDPYLDHLGTAVLGGLAGGLRTYPVLQSKPYKIELDLNDWFRFDRPGHYRLYLKSHRLTRERASGESGDRTVQFAAVSNIIDVEIQSEDPAWNLAKLSEIKAVLDQLEPEQPKPGGPPVTHNPIIEKIILARRELRYMGTPDAVQLSFEVARKSAGGLDVLLLVAARDRRQMVAAFDRYLADPQVGIQEWDIQVRALFTLLQKDAPKPLPVFMWQQPDDLKQFWSTVEVRQKRFEQIVREEAIRLIPVAAGKDADVTGARRRKGRAPGSARRLRPLAGRVDRAIFRVSARPTIRSAWREMGLGARSGDDPSIAQCYRQGETECAKQCCDASTGLGS